MKGWMLNNIGDIRFQEIEKPVPGTGEACLRVMAAGICGSDIPRIYTTGAHRMPLIPGHEFSGVVDSVGEGVPETLVGKKVGVFPLIPCGKCFSCKTGHPETCRSYDYVGSRRDGAFAEYVSVPAENLIELPGSVSFEEAAMLEPMAVAVHAMRIGTERIGKEIGSDPVILVCGMGTIGQLLTMFLLERGFSSVYVIGNKEGQKDRAVRLGLPEKHFMDSRKDDICLAIKEGLGGADLYFECVGKNESLSYGIECTKPFSSVVLVGNPYSDMTLSRDTYWKILRNQVTVSGTWNSTFLGENHPDASNDDWHYVMNCLADGRIHPECLITQKFLPEDLEKGFCIMRDKSEDYCKVMMVAGP